MASIKNLKSKGKAALSSPLGREYNAEYALRKRQFAALPPAKVVRPLRSVRGVYERALAVWSREADAFNRGQGPLPAYPYRDEDRYRTALAAAAAGKGQLVHRCAS